MKEKSLLRSMAKLMVGVMLIAPLHGCILPGNVKMDSSSITDALSSLGKTGNGKKDWPFTPTEKERGVSSYSDGVMRQAMTGRSVRAGYTAEQKTDIKQQHAAFMNFMASAPQMSDWTAQEAVQYSGYLSKLIPVTDAIIAADEQKGSKSDAALKQEIVGSKGALKGNILTIPAHSAVSVNMQAYCADRHFSYPSARTTPVSTLVPASFAQAVPNELAGHLRNVSNSIASGKVKMANYEMSQVIWSLTEAGNFTKNNVNILQPANESLLNKMSPNLYSDFSAYNTSAALAKGQKQGFVYGDDRDDILKPQSVVNIPAKNVGQNSPSGILESGTYYYVTNNAFSPTITVYNSTGTEQKIDFSRYGLVHDGSEMTQKLILTGVSHENGMLKGSGKDTGADSESLALAKSIAMDIERATIAKGGEYLGELGHNPAFLANQSRLAKRMASNVFKNFLRKAPLAASMVALNEGVTGEDFISGRQLTGIERGLSFLEATPMPGARAEAMAAKMNWTKVASAINAYGNSVRGSLYWEAAGFGLEAYKQTLGNTGDYLANKWNSEVFQSEGQKALIFINGSGAAIDQMIARFGI